MSVLKTPLPDRFECAVCGELMVAPRSCEPCGHSFCEPCLRCLAKESSWFSTLCPICRTAIIDTRENTDLKTKIESSDARIVAAYRQREAWLSQQRRVSRMRLPGGFYSYTVPCFDSCAEFAVRCAGAALLVCLAPIIVPATVIAATLLGVVACALATVVWCAMMTLTCGVCALVATCFGLFVGFMIWLLLCVYWPELLMDLLDCVAPGRSWFANV